ncbi:MAG: signal peptidase I [Alphaproteobacteria bacterium]|nr:signal peptidase I [Alphaproteobacteria bacterium]MBV8413356.1 signal peptidase I [Alphaproteobacteria bacterium]
MSDQTKGRPKSGWLRTLWAALLSLVIPGLGHIYAGAWRLGLVFFLVAIAFESALIAGTRIVPPTPVALAMVVAGEALFRLAVAADAGRRVRSGSIVAGRPWYRSAWVAVVPMIAIGVAWQNAIIDYYRPGWRSFYVPSSSNVPTLLTMDYVMADTHHAGSMPDYGDMVVFRHPKDPTVDYIKRVVGLPGDRVQLRDAILYLNGKAVPREPLQGDQYRETLPNGHAYTILEVPQGAGRNTQEFVVPAGSFFALGDNRGNSLDSRFEAVGYVPAGNVIGTARTIYWSSEPGRVLSRVQ